MYFLIFLQCKVTQQQPGDGLDNDCDEKIDEEIRDGKDNDGDGRIDEDLALVRTPVGRKGMHDFCNNTLHKRLLLSTTKSSDYCFFSAKLHGNNQGIKTIICIIIVLHKDCALKRVLLQKYILKYFETI